VTGARDEVLARVRGAVAAGSRTRAGPRARPEPEVEGAVVIPREYQVTGTGDVVATFIERLEHYDATARRVGPDEIGEAVRALLGERGVRRLVAPEGIPEDWLADVEPLRDSPALDPHTLDGTDGTISTCRLAIAQTGTIVLDGTAGMGRRALSLVPDYLMCVVGVAQIVGLVPEAIAQLDASRPLTFISGPSATVDIEMVRVAGVHGPRRLDVIVAG
jgi:L-lactate dehydrogenase complex protein LldG